MRFNAAGMCRLMLSGEMVREKCRNVSEERRGGLDGTFIGVCMCVCFVVLFAARVFRTFSGFARVNGRIYAACNSHATESERAF